MKKFYQPLIPIMMFFSYNTSLLSARNPHVEVAHAVQLQPSKNPIIFQNGSDWFISYGPKWNFAKLEVYSILGVPIASSILGKNGQSLFLISTPGFFYIKVTALDGQFFLTKVTNVTNVK